MRVRGVEGGERGGGGKGCCKKTVSLLAIAEL